MDDGDYTARMTELIELMRLIGNDTQQCEVKECGRRISSTITDTLSAFSNGNGGYIILGLSEKRGFTPVEGFNARSMQEALSQACEKMTPVVRPVIVTCPFEGTNLVFAVVDEMLPRDKPCFLTAAGPYAGSYIRTGDGDRRMTAYEVDRLMEEQRQPDYDLGIVPGATIEDLNPALVYGLLERERERHPRVFEGRGDVDMLRDLRVLIGEDEARARHPDAHGGAKDADTADGGNADSGNAGGRTDGGDDAAPVLRPTLAGLMALGRYPQKFYPRLAVTLAVFPGTSREEVFVEGAQLVTAETITGPIPVMIDNTVESLTDWTAGAPHTEPDYPCDVLREVVANALMHRDYSPDAQGTPVQVCVFTDRIEVTNPGGLFGAVTSRTLARPANASTRNPFLFALLQSTPYPDGGAVTDSDGTGYRSIEAALRREGREPARIDNAIDRFTIVIPRRRTGPDDAGERNFAQRIMTFLERHARAGVRDLMTELGMSPIEVATGLRALKNKGLVESETVQVQPQRYYHLTDAALHDAVPRPPAERSGMSHGPSVS
ncbi:dihydroorotate dehydrogenase [Bifidobacterium sp. DSM 109958]|uniref:Dihydroorotate dehydrogenase n=1 Tax=Bifidobacterium moraviense TaxID=2675323 RepID=A0A7Y0F0Z2_9BIFI|nr:ATP-binding protein [Bifidobacterium sp. DSM 109958]NMN00016.1 dihydroorotate dehydrogenase [Bifidobacterium sp. DSM 109958]